MLLKKIRLQNIRSYVDETVSFNEGSSLLSGDIGCGKSSILLAVEFALFGTSRPDLPAELLLRKGTNVGNVKLEFMIGGQEISIERVIKKDKRSIKQLPGSLVVEGVKKELMPVELKAEVISLLGYPEELLGKNKNYIFRYTVYTPQEEMKFILQENEDVRLDVLRKIFNIDKYKVVRENVLLFCKKLRGEIAEFKIRVEPLGEFKEQWNGFEESRKKLELQLSDVEPALVRIGKERIAKEEQVKSLESKQKDLLLKREELQRLSLVLVDKKKQQQELNDKLQALNLEINKDFVAANKEELQEQLVVLENEKRFFLERRVSLQQKVNYLQEQMQRVKQEMVSLEKAINSVVDQEKFVLGMQEKIGEKSVLQKRQEDVRLSLETINAQLAAHNLTLTQSKEIRDKIKDLDNCPFCLQEVGVQHKEHILQQEQGKIGQADGLLQGLVQQKKQLIAILEEDKNKLEEVFVLEKDLMKISTELRLVQDKKIESEKKKQQIKNYVQENNQIMPMLGELSAEKLTLIEQKCKVKQEELNRLLKRESLQKHFDDLQKQSKIVDDEIVELGKKIGELNVIIGESLDFSEQIVASRRELEEKANAEKVLVMQKTEFVTSISHVVERIKDVCEKIELLKEYEKKLIKLKEMHHWLVDFFVKLTYTIEKHVMGNIHYLFNDFFKQWFAILIDDDGLQARIDDTFSPVIEQNGYEISFGNLSGGERTSAALAYRLALNRVINDVVHQIKTKSILILDEPTDGFSSEQLDKVRDVLDRLGLRQTIIVSHESKIESFVENIIRIGKEGHQSYVMG